MNRTLHCANVQHIGNAHSHITPDGITTPRTLPAQNSLKAAASAVLARTTPRTLPAHCDQQARTLPAQSAAECAGNVQGIQPDLERLIQRAAAYWQYSPDDLATIYQAAQRDPEGLRLALENDAAFRLP